MRIKLSDLIIYVIAVLLTFFSTSGSFYPMLSPSNQLLLVLLLGGILVTRVGKKVLQKNVETMLVLSMVMIYLLNNSDLKRRSYWGVLFLFPVLLYFVLASSHLNIKWVTCTLRMMSAIYLMYAFYTILMYFDSGLLRLAIRVLPYVDEMTAARMWKQYNNGWMPGLTTHYSTNGMLLVVGFLIYGAAFICKKRKRYFFCFLVMLIALLLTAKRAHIIFGTVCLYIAYYVYSADKKRGRLFKLLGIALLSIALFLVVSNYVPALSSFVRRFIDASEEGDVTMGRAGVWLIVYGIFRNHPITGIGWGQFVNKGYWFWDAHNIYFQLLCETGIIGFGIYLLWMILFVIKTWRRLSNIRKNKELYVNHHEEMALFFSLAMQLFFMMYGATGNPLYEQIQYIPYFIACAISLDSIRGKFEELAGD